MFERLKNLKGEGIYIVYSKSFDSLELMNLMAPVFVVGIKKDGYIVIFDPRSTTITGVFNKEEDEISRELKDIFEKILGMELNVEKKLEFDDEDSDVIASIKDDVDFYEGMGVMVLESDDDKPISEKEFSKVVDRFKIFTLVSEYTKNQRYSPEEFFLSLSPGMSGMGAFLSVEARFMIWIKNETKVEGEKFRYSLIRAFNVVVSKIAGKFGYERMSILPYETMIILTRNVNKFKRFLHVLDVVNEKIKPYLAEKFPVWAENMKAFDTMDIIDTIKSKEDFLDMIASIPTTRGVNILKRKISNSIDNFNRQLSIISRELGKWVDDLLEKVL